jgi:hypothetical protein
MIGGKCVCENCKYFLATNSEWGECRKYAPKPLTIGTLTPVRQPESATWPFVHHWDACGEFVVTPGGFSTND